MTEPTFKPDATILQQYEEMMRDVALKHWDESITHLDALCEHPVPTRDHRDYLKVSTFKSNAIKAQLGTLKDFAKTIAGTALGVRGTNTKEKKALETDILTDVRRRLENRGIITKYEKPEDQQDS